MINKKSSQTKNMQTQLSEIENRLKEIEKLNQELLWGSYFQNSIASSNWVLDRSFSATNGAANYSLLYKLFKVYDIVKPKNILEFGLGQSTSLTRQYCVANKSAHAIVCDDSREWVKTYESTIEGVDNLKLLFCDTEDFVLPDGSVGAEDTQYKGLKPKLKKITKEPFDLVVVDGPVGVGKPYSRTDILGLVDNLAKTFVVIIDDSNRVGEQSTITLLRKALEEKKKNFADWTVNSTKQQTIFASKDVADILWSV